jgi:hypothetical protein
MESKMRIENLGSSMQEQDTNGQINIVELATSVAETKKPKIRKIPVELRRRKTDFSFEPAWYKRIVWRLREDSQFLRSAIQLAFVLLCIWIGVEFYLFMQWGTAGGEFFERPPGAEGFLPISALMSL